uniref:Uncharacterized protein n=1 Tax=Anguilla anguilla TaxID=7936 RepID=A0A0E9VC23_ANGAN
MAFILHQNWQELSITHFDHNISLISLATLVIAV